MTADVKQARLPPGQRIFIKAVTVGFDKMARSCDDSVGWCLANSTCANLTSFVPETGKSYSIRHDVTSKSCGIVLIDQSTNLPPTTTKVEPVAGACKP